MSEWENAQMHTTFSLDLTAAALKLLQMLSRVHSTPSLFTEQSLKRAIHRYEYCWLALAAQGSIIFPPLDCEWIWHCHRLNPGQYAKDCKEVCGRTIDDTLQCEELSSRVTWTAAFPDEPYDFSSSDSGKYDPIKYSLTTSRISYDLLDAARRQESFYYQVCEPHYLDHSFLAAAEKRYKGFLHLIKVTQANIIFFVPTYDIDLMWHAHQLSPICYQRDTIQKLATFINHDDTDSSRDRGGKLDSGFQATCEAWERAYGFRYSKAGCMYRGEQPRLDNKDASLLCETKATFGFLSTDDKIKNSIPRREIIQVRLVARAPASMKSHSLVIKTLSNAKKLKATGTLNQELVFEAEMATEGIVVEVVRAAFLGSKAGEVVLLWKDILGDELQSAKRSILPLPKTNKVIKDDAEVLQLFVSVTPPMTGPHLLRSVVSRDIGDDNSNSAESRPWITDTVYDHTAKEVFVTSSRYRIGTGFLGVYPKGDKNDWMIRVHRGGWSYIDESTNKGSVSGQVLTTAVILDDYWHYTRWSLLGNSIVLEIRRDPVDRKWNLRPRFVISQSNQEQCPFTLVSGRKLEFTVPGSSEKNEACFVTMVRMTKDAPQGKATALFNWRSGRMQICPDEDPVLVLLLRKAISLSVTDQLHKSIPPQRFNSRRRSYEGNDHFGAFTNRGGHDQAPAFWWIQDGNSQQNVPSAACGISPSAAGGGCSNGGGCGSGGGCGGGGCGGGGCGGG